MMYQGHVKLLVHAKQPSSCPMPRVLLTVCQQLITLRFGLSSFAGTSASVRMSSVQWPATAQHSIGVAKQLVRVQTSDTAAPSFSLQPDLTTPPPPRGPITTTTQPDNHAHTQANSHPTRCICSLCMT